MGTTSSRKRPHEPHHGDQHGGEISEYQGHKQGRCDQVEKAVAEHRSRAWVRGVEPFKALGPSLTPKCWRNNHAYGQGIHHGKGGNFTRIYKPNSLWPSWSDAAKEKLPCHLGKPSGIDA